MVKPDFVGPLTLAEIRAEAMNWLSARVAQEEQCLIWRGFFDRYGAPRGRIPWLAGSLSVRRALWERLNGKTLGTRLIRMTCGNRDCVNPEHMRPVSKKKLFEHFAKDGVFDCPIAKAKRAVAAKNRGRHYSPEAKAKIFALRQSGQTYKQIGSEMGMDWRHIGRILTGHAWVDFEGAAANSSVFSWRPAA